MRHRRRDGRAPRSAWAWAPVRAALVLARAQVEERAVEVYCIVSASRAVVRIAKVLGKSAPMRVGVACVLTCVDCYDGARDRAKE